MIKMLGDIEDRVLNPLIPPRGRVRMYANQQKAARPKKKGWFGQVDVPVKSKETGKWAIVPIAIALGFISLLAAIGPKDKYYLAEE